MGLGLSNCGTIGAIDVDSIAVTWEDVKNATESDAELTAVKSVVESKLDKERPTLGMV